MPLPAATLTVSRAIGAGDAVVATLEANRAEGGAPADAKVTLVVFDDYQCPYCARLERFIHQVLEQFPNDVKYVIKHFPLSNHPFAHPGAMASLAAGKQGKFWEFQEKLFSNQGKHSIWSVSGSGWHY